MMEFRLVILLGLQVFWVRRIVVLIYGLVYVYTVVYGFVTL